jgi:hypothetical protein
MNKNEILVHLFELCAYSKIFGFICSENEFFTFEQQEKRSSADPRMKRYFSINKMDNEKLDEVFCSFLYFLRKRLRLELDFIQSGLSRKFPTISESSLPFCAELSIILEDLYEIPVDFRYLDSRSKAEKWEDILFDLVSDYYLDQLSFSTAPFIKKTCLIAIGKKFGPTESQVKKLRGAGNLIIFIGDSSPLPELRKYARDVVLYEEANFESLLDRLRSYCQEVQLNAIAKCTQSGEEDQIIDRVRKEFQIHAIDAIH